MSSLGSEFRQLYSNIRVALKIEKEEFFYSNLLQNIFRFNNFIKKKNTIRDVVKIIRPPLRAELIILSRMSIASASERVQRSHSACRLLSETEL